MSRPERNLTQLFLQRRSSCRRGGSGGSGGHNPFQKPQSQSRVPLTEGNSEMDAVVPDEPPEWVSFQKMRDEDFKTLDYLLRELEKLNQQKLLPTFDDREERRVNHEIQKATLRFKNKLKSMEKEIKALANKNDWKSVNEMRVGESIASELSTKLKEKSDRFRRIQRGFVEQMSKLKSSADDAMATNGAGGPTSTTSMLLVDENEITTRHQEAQKIVKMIGEVAEMFHDLSVLIVEQGTIVDRIDYNLEVAAARTIKGTDELQKAAEHNKKAAGKALKCIFVQMTLITVLMTAWLLNHRYG